MIKKIFIGLGVVFVIIFIIGLGSGGSKTEPSKIGEANDKRSDINQLKEFKVGDLVKLGEREFVVNSADRKKAIGYSEAKPGQEYVVVNVTITNLGKDEVSYNPFDFKIQDINGAQETQSFAILDDPLNSGTLIPNGKVTGSISFEVPQGTAAKLIFQPSFWSNDKVVVVL